MTPDGIKSGRDRGFALLIVLWSVVLLTLLATQITATGRTEAQLAANLRAAAVAEAAADGAVQATAFHLLDATAPWAANGQERTLRVPGATVTVQVQNEAGKVNPNFAEPELMRALLRRLGADTQTAERLSAAIADWRTPGNPAHPISTRATPYRAAGLDYGPPGAPFTDPEELGAVLGMTPVLLARLRPYVSVLTDMPPDPIVAAAPVRQALQDAFGPPRPTPPVPLRTVLVTAQAVGDAGGHFTRSSVLRIGTAARDAPVAILTWDALPR